MHPVPRAQALGSLRVTEKCKSTTYQNNCVVWPTLGAPSLVSRFDYWSSVPQHSTAPCRGLAWRTAMRRGVPSCPATLLTGPSHGAPLGPQPGEGGTPRPHLPAKAESPAARATLLAHGHGGGGERGAAMPGGRVACGGACSWPRRRRGPLGRWAANKTLTQPLPMIMVKYETYEHDNDKDK